MAIKSIECALRPTILAASLLASSGALANEPVHSDPQIKHEITAIASAVADVNLTANNDTEASIEPRELAGLAKFKTDNWSGFLYANMLHPEKDLPIVMGCWLGHEHGPFKLSGGRKALSANPYWALPALRTGIADSSQASLTPLKQEGVELSATVPSTTIDLGAFSGAKEPVASLSSKTSLGDLDVCSRTIFNPDQIQSTAGISLDTPLKPTLIASVTHADDQENFFGAAELSYEVEAGNATLTPYARYELHSDDTPEKWVAGLHAKLQDAVTLRAEVSSSDGTTPDLLQAAVQLTPKVSN